MEIIHSSLLKIAKSSSPDELILKGDLFSSIWREVFVKSEEMGASDIHIIQDSEDIKVKFRILGDLFTIKEIPNENDIKTILINRLKTICRFDLSVTDEAQDRAFSLKITNSRYRSVLTPGIFGENFVFRVIRESDLPRISDCSIPDKICEDLLFAINQRQGFICITGPTGSGKSTTLQAAIMELDRFKKNVITIEDPVERIIPGVVQQQITSKLTWAKAIKSAMRQDPDVILVGEIRDMESAKLALEASQTGHLVLATLHTNNVAGIVDRLIGLGVEKRIIADNLLFISSQRLIQRLCSGCRIRRDDFGFDRGNGCEKCSSSKVPGINGRTSLIEYSIRPSSESVINFNKDSFQKNELKTTLASEAKRLALIGEISFDEYQYWSHEGI